MKSTTHTGRSLAARICISVGLLVTSVVTLRLYRDDGIRIRENFRHSVDVHAAAIDAQVSADIAVLQSVKALFDASERVTRPEFHTFATFLRNRYPSIKALGWIPRVTADGRAVMEVQAHSEGLAGFQFTERQAQGDMVPAADRDEYFPVCFMEPLAGNEAGMGFDLGSDKTRLEALHDARDTGEARASGRVTLVQETRGEFAVLILVPVYREHPMNTVARRDALIGFISGVFRLHDLLLAAGVHVPDDGLVAMELLDISAPPHAQMLHEITVGDRELMQGYRQETELRMTAGRQWTLIETPSKAYIAERRSIIPTLSLLVGFLITGWLSFYLKKLAHEQQQVEKLVDKRTRELRVQSTALAAANTRLKREISERRHLQERFATVIDHEQRRLGQELHDSLGQQVAVTTMLTQTLEKRLTAGAAVPTRLLARLATSAKDAQSQVRALSKGLLPVEINPGSLKRALAELTTSVKGLSETDVQLSCDEDAVVDDAAAATHLYRIAQEALRNALEHGRGTQVTITLEKRPDALVLKIQDNGQGFTTGKTTSSGAGLSTMRHRADIIGASLSVDATPGEGTTITCVLV
jgi:signal transduction histidine kinase/sensor domain CHASE-containing protein